MYEHRWKDKEKRILDEKNVLITYRKNKYK